MQDRSNDRMPAKLEDGMLVFADGGITLLDVPATVTTMTDPLAHGVFLHVTMEKPAARQRMVLGRPGNLRRFTCSYRYDPWWMTPKIGTSANEIPVETQFLLAECTDGRYAVFIPLLDNAFRVSLEGDADGQLVLIAETGDPTVVGTEMTGVFIAVGADPYALIATAAESVTAYMQTGRLRKDKPVPDFIDQFGWCTWDAFYTNVSHDLVRQGLQSFVDGGVQPKMMILDDGWLSMRTFTSGENRLTAFAADAEKFPGDLHPTVTMAKGEFDIATFLVWHALQGYWGGIDPVAFPAYRVFEEQRAFSPGILSHSPEINSAFGDTVGVIAPESIHRFYQDFHRHLREQGVDGVKVDNQSALEGVSRGLGGRTALMRAYHEALEGAAHTHFLGRIINCMSQSSDVIFSTLNSTVTRAFTDFWPNQPASHGLHLFANAFNSLWLGEFILPDWDMFQSGHAMGAFHAAGRAVSGGPVYVSDKPDEHNFDLLRKMVLSDGTVLRAQQAGRPTRDILFRDVMTEPVLLKIFNYNEGAGVIGVFNAQYHEAEEERITLSSQISAADVEGLPGKAFAIFAHTTQALSSATGTEQVPVSLPELSFELFTIVPIDGVIAPIGLADKFNSAGAITAKGWTTENEYTICLRDGGQFLAWCEQQPAKVFVDDEPLSFSYDEETNALRLTIEATGSHVIRVITA